MQEHHPGLSRKYNILPTVMTDIKQVERNNNELYFVSTKNSIVVINNKNICEVVMWFISILQRIELLFNNLFGKNSIVCKLLFHNNAQ